MNMWVQYIVFVTTLGIHQFKWNTMKLSYNLESTCGKVKGFLVELGTI